MSRNEPPTTDPHELLLREIRDLARESLQVARDTLVVMCELRDRRPASATSSSGRGTVGADGVRRTVGGEPPPDEAKAPAHFPNFGRNAKGPIAGATMKDLEFYLDKANASLKNPNAARYVGHNQSLIEAINAEIRRQLSQRPDDAPPDFG